MQFVMVIKTPHRNTFLSLKFTKPLSIIKSSTTNKPAVSRAVQKELSLKLWKMPQGTHESQTASPIEDYYFTVSQTTESLFFSQFESCVSLAHIFMYYFSQKKSCLVLHSSFTPHTSTVCANKLIISLTQICLHSGWNPYHPPFSFWCHWHIQGHSCVYLCFLDCQGPTENYSVKTKNKVNQKLLLWFLHIFLKIQTLAIDALEMWYLLSL